MLSLLLMVLALGGLAVLNPHLVDRLGDGGGNDVVSPDDSGLGRLLPADDTILAIEFPDLEAALDGLEAYRDRLRPRGPGATPHLDEMVDQAIDHLGRVTLGEPIRNREGLGRLGLLPGGAAAILVRRRESRPGEVTAFRPPDPGACAADLAGRARREAEGRMAAAVIEEDWGSGPGRVHRIRVFSESGGKGEAAAEEYEVCIAEADGWVLLAKQYPWDVRGSGDAPPPSLLRILDTAAGRRESLADRGAGPGVTVEGRIARVHAVVPNLLRFAMDEDELPAESISGGFSALIGEIGAGPNGLALAARAGGDGKLAPFLREPSEPGGRLVPTDGLVAAQFVSVDPGRLFPVIETFLPDRAAREEYEDGLREIREEVGYDLRREVTESVAGEAFVAFYGFVVAGGREIEMPRLLGGIRAADADRALRAVSRFVAAAMDQPRSVRVGGREMFRVEGERRRGEFLEWGLLDGWLVWATDAGLIESAVRAAERDAPSLATDHGWRYDEVDRAPFAFLADPGRIRRLLPDPGDREERELLGLLDAIGPVLMTLRPDGSGLSLSLTAGDMPLLDVEPAPYRTTGSIAMLVVFVLAAINLFRPGRRR